MTLLFDLKDLVGKTGRVKLAWTYQENWSLLVSTSEGKTWAGRGPDLEALCLHSLDALDSDWASR
jgi:hypothetical protein